MTKGNRTNHPAKPRGPYQPREKPAKVHLTIRIAPAVKAQLMELARQRGKSAADLIEDWIKENKMDTDKIYYCSACGNFWRWQWSIENGGYYFAAFIPEQEVPEDADFDKQNCGCNE